MYTRTCLRTPTLMMSPLPTMPARRSRYRSFESGAPLPPYQSFCRQSSRASRRTRASQSGWKRRRAPVFAGIRGQATLHGQKVLASGSWKICQAQDLHLKRCLVPLRCSVLPCTASVRKPDPMSENSGKKEAAFINSRSCITDAMEDACA